MAVEQITRRMGVFAELAETSKRRFGRTALMKLCYLLQTVKNVPLGYDFSLYSYGPYDAQVLSDLNTAEGVGILKSDLESYPSGYGYLISASGSSSAARDVASAFLERHKSSISWVVANFAHRTASELELITTIVFVQKDRGAVSRSTLLKTVKEIKPHFSENEIEKKWSLLVDLGVLS